ncbi:MAG: alpha-amylase family glycosyl hydrolase [Pseudomonadota bacterium]|nr:alpha-amylase family glycosyl hydrolase [Pseudomonadota bacterium]
MRNLLHAFLVAPLLSIACVAPDAAHAPLSADADAPGSCTLAPHPATLPEAPCCRDELGLTYEIYVRSFQDSDGDGIGDLPGVQSRLDHLEALGVRTLWLMPLFESVGPAGYDVLDFDLLQPEYGDPAALRALVEDAHARDIRVLLDLPFNHVARTHPWFLEAERDPGSPLRDLFVFADTQWDPYRWFPAEGGGYYYAFFGAALPDLDWTEAEVGGRMQDVFAQWLDAGADGYRLDAVPTLVESDGGITGTSATHSLLHELHAFVRDTSPGAVLLAEASAEAVEENAAYLGSPNAPESERVLDFPRRPALLAALAQAEPGPLLEVLHAQQDLGVLGRTAPFLSSHDLPRLPAAVPDAAARRLLQVLQLTLPGDPVLYYGEELDLADATSGTGQDLAQRAPMPWDDSPNGGFTTSVAWYTLDPGYTLGANVAAAEADPTSLLTLLRDLACVRDAIDGADWALVATDVPSVFGYARTTEDGRVLVVANLASVAVGEIRVDAHGAFWDLTNNIRSIYAADGLVLPGLPPYGYGVYSDEIADRCLVAGPV